MGDTTRNSDATPTYSAPMQPTPLNRAVRLESMVPFPGHMEDSDDDVADETVEFPSKGSYGHYTGSCKPCAFLHNRGCENGINCPFCHLCEEGEKKKRRKEKQQIRKDAKTYKHGRIASMPRLSNGAASTMPAGRLL